MISAWRSATSKDSFVRFHGCERFEVIERSKLLDSVTAEGQDASSRSRRSRTDENR